MKILTRVVIAVAVLTSICLAQSETVEHHVVWDRVFDSVPVSEILPSSSAVSDANGGVWIAVDHPPGNEGIPVRVVHVSPTGELLSSESLPDSLLPQTPSHTVSIRLAALSSGQIAVLADYSHSRGKTVFFDGAKLALIAANGHIAPVKPVVRGGRWYRGFIGLSNEQLLVMGDQTPMTLTDVTVAGDILWHKTFPGKWVLPSGASLQDGAICVASPEYASPVVHVIRMTSSGAVRHSASIAARRAEVAAGPDGTCLVLFDTEPKLEKGEFFLTSFDREFHRRWTKSVGFSAPMGGTFNLIALNDGILVAAEEGIASRGTFLAKYGFSGDLLWTVNDSSLNAPSDVVSSGNGFFLITSGGDDHNSLRVVFAR